MSRAYFFSASKFASALAGRPCGPCGCRSTAFSSACGVAPAAFSARAAGVSDAASATSSRSCATYSSPALVAACCAASSTRTSSGVICGWPAPEPCTFGSRASSACTPAAAGFRVAAGGADQPGGGAFLVVQQRLEQVLGRDPLVEFADGDGLRGLQESPRALGELLDVHRLLSLYVGDWPCPPPLR